MPQSLSFILVHIIFSTKDRRPLVTTAVQLDLYAYLATIVRNTDCECYRVGGMVDHVHIAIRLSRTKNIAELVAELKASSSRWMKTQGVPKFAWQRGYAAFSVGPADREALLHYIDTQEAHHRKHDFQDELRTFLKKYSIEVNERYVWD
jgi:putative transposase